MKRSFILLILLSYFQACTPTTEVDQNQPVTYTKQAHMIPMRDGTSLYTEIYIPDRREGDLPFLIKRSPYGMHHSADSIHSALSGTYKELADEQFIFVFQDIRGRYQSEGRFVMLRPARDTSDENSIDEGTDTFDTIEWLLENIEGHNGKVGQLGISYDGWLTVMSLLEPHPALAATSPQASPSDMFIGDDFLHNGALRLSPAFGYAALMESGKTNMPFPYDPADTYEFFLQLGPLKNANLRYFHDSLPSWNNFMEHPNYDAYWEELNVDHHLTHVNVPTLHVAGWWDAEDFYGPLKIYETLEAYDDKDMNFLVVGPWPHGGWAGTSGQTLGALDFGSETSVYFKKLQTDWFSRHLKNKSGDPWPEALTFRSGSNEWMRTEAWPPASAETTRYYLNGDLELTPQPTEDNVSFTSNPANPVPYMPRPIPGFWQHASSKYLWKVQDQQFIKDRDDVLTYRTPPLSTDMALTGDIRVQLVAATTGTDADWIVKLIDEYPVDTTNMSGYQLMVADDVLRGKFRNGFSSPEPVPANLPVPYGIDLNTRNHTFKKGHRIVVQVQSTWFPLIGRNPQTFVNIPEANEEDYQSAEHTIYGNSFVELPLVQLE